MCDDPQIAARRDYWMAHDGPVYIADMPDEHVLNAYKTCVRHDNPKQDELLRELEERNIEWRLS